MTDKDLTWKVKKWLLDNGIRDKFSDEDIKSLVEMIKGIMEDK